ncbi:uncharacterized protein EHS24_008948 [Apiotrichum porosum]|uniref:PCI domain-containing protein n=1 Tax=Apiotrichum porosum TaxID=105984 RepID=A0A427XNM1_9TREE|nr:uncharacterized protein EHS24_008948 [Apiotrichum porosum]RSH80372.1 hypothetical protein EHS24_008948 [Apiotrichum porosum]
MSNSSWPPQLKFVDLAAVNAELKQILFQAHRDNSVNTTDWSKVELNALKAQTYRTAVAPPPPPPLSYPTFAAPVYTTPAASVTTPTTPKKNKKKRKNDIHTNNATTTTTTTTSTFPSAYTFESAEEAEAKARRLARFQTPAQPSSSNGTGVGHWFNPDEDAGGSALGSRISGGPVSPTLGRKKLKGKSGLGYSEVHEADPNVIDWDAYTIRGTSTKLEKSYLRLTSEPSPADIRPLPVLQQTLQLLKQKWRADHNYAYAVDQFKSMRQDLTVQRIKNEFTVEVYEIHARIALEAKDLGEYNQCQSMLRQLYELGLPGHPAEFLSYRIIYLLHTRNRSDMASMLSQLTPEEKADSGVAHALEVARSLATSNYTKFFRLFLEAPAMSGYIMDHFVERERAQALAVMSKAYLTLPLPYLTKTLAFESDEETDKFLSEHHAAIYVNVPDPNAPAKRDPANPWKSISKPKPVPLEDRIWDCKKAHHACAKGVEKYRVVDIKGQVD